MKANPCAASSSTRPAFDSFMQRAFLLPQSTRPIASGRRSWAKPQRGAEAQGKNLLTPGTRKDTTIVMVSPRSLLAAAALSLVACQDPPAPAPAPSATPAPVASAAPAPTPTPEAPKPAPTETKPPEQIAAQHVLIAYKGSKNAPKTVTRSKADAKKRAEEVAAKAKAGGDFTSLVKEYSDDTATVERLGSLGKFKADGMVKPFSDAAFALKVDQISDPVETPFGFHVIKRNQ